MLRHVHKAEGGGAGDSRERFTGRPLPLHSKRLTGAVIQQISQGLEVPATASTAETRQLIEGKLGKMGRNHQQWHQHYHHGWQALQEGGGCGPLEASELQKGRQDT